MRKKILAFVFAAALLSGTGTVLAQPPNPPPVPADVPASTQPDPAVLTAAGTANDVLNQLEVGTIPPVP